MLGARPSRTLSPLLAVALLFSASRAAAYTWMMRHEYTQCVPCHADPSGSGPLTPYGRSIGDEVLRTRWYGEQPPADGAAPSAGFLWGAIQTPEALMLSGELRFMHLRTKVENTEIQTRNIWMRADLEGAVRSGNFLALGSIGYAHEGALGAALTRSTEHNLISRQHWAGYHLTDGLLVRAGRMNLPYGLRIIEHTSWVRQLTRTNTNDQQQYGVAVSYGTQRARAELMGILGNLQLRPDVFRERGYSATGEWAVDPKLTLGASSLITYRELDPQLFRETWRHAHGLFGRWATPFRPLFVMAEWNYTMVSPKFDLKRKGFVGFLQADLEPVQGIHVIATGEAHDVGIQGVDVPGPPFSWGAWLSYAWFFAPHADVRLDSIYQSLGSTTFRVDAFTLLVQGHVYL